MIIVNHQFFEFVSLQDQVFQLVLEYDAFQIPERLMLKPQMSLELRLV